MSEQAHTITLKDALAALDELPQILTAKQAADAVGVSVVTIRRRIQEGALRAVRTQSGRGGRYRILKLDVAQLFVEMNG